MALKLCLYERGFDMYTPTEDEIRNNGAIPNLDQVTQYGDTRTSNKITLAGPFILEDSSAIVDFTAWQVSGGFRNTSGVIEIYDGSSWKPIGGQLINQGTWNANTNTPTLADGTGTQGHFYIVSTGGSTSLDGITDWVAGDWAYFDGTVWRKIDNTDVVGSVFGRTGAVVAAASDYDASQIDNDSAVSGTYVSNALNTLNDKLVRVAITAVGGSGGATAGTISVQVSDIAGTAIARAVNIKLLISDTDGAGSLDAAANCQFGAATTGTLVIGSGAAAAIVTTDATGLYEGALANAVDETCYFSADSTDGGAASNAAGCVVAECVTASATWAA